MSESKPGMPNMILTAEAVVRPAVASVAANFQPPHVAQTYLIAAVQAVLAATQVAAFQPTLSANLKEVVSKVQVGLAALEPELQAPIDATSWQSAATQVIGMIQGVLPVVAPFLGPAAPFVTLGIMVAQMVIVATQTTTPFAGQLHLAPR